MSIGPAVGSKMYISTPAAMAAVDWKNDTDAAIITALSDVGVTWTEIGEIEDLGEFGDEASEITFTSLSDRRVRKIKGTFNAGTVTSTVGSDPGDAGQAAMRAAFASDLDYPFKIVLNDKQTQAGTPTELYFAGKVMSKRRNVGNAENVIRQTYPVGINTKIAEKEAT